MEDSPGEQMRRAIDAFIRKHNRPPNALLVSRNALRLYKRDDPELKYETLDSERPLHITCQGVPVYSKDGVEGVQAVGSDITSG